MAPESYGPPEIDPLPPQSFTMEGSPPTTAKPNPSLLTPQSYSPKKGTSSQDIHRPIPHSDDAEKAVLCCMLLDPSEVIPAIIEKTAPSAFHAPSHRILFETIVELYDKNKPVELIALTQLLHDRGTLDKVGGAATVTELQTFLPTATNYDYYLEILQEKDTLREIIHTCTGAVQRCYGEQENVPELLDEVERHILAIRDRKEQSSFKQMREQVMDAIESIEKIYQNRGGITGVSTGFNDLDEMTSGMHGGEMIVIAARPSMGKTSLAMNIAEHVAIDQQKSTAVFSLEMSSQQLVQRMLCSRAKVDMHKLREGFLSEKRDFPRLMDAAAKMAESPIYIDDTPGISILELRAKARRLKNSQNIELIVIDYLQLLRSTSRRAQDNRQLEISEISAGIKALAKELDIPIIVLAQLNRQSEGRPGGKPRLSDLRESGSIEQDADLVGLLVRPEVYEDDQEAKEEMEGHAELIIAKQRNGPVGEVPLTFLKPFTRFENRAFRGDE